MGSFLEMLLGEAIWALLIWALILKVRSRRKAKDSGPTTDSLPPGMTSSPRGSMWTKLTEGELGLFLAIWAVLVAMHIFIFPSANDRERAAPEAVLTNVKATDHKNSETLFAKNAEVLSIVRQVILGGVVDKQTHDRFWSAVPESLKSTSAGRQAVRAVGVKDMQYQMDFWKSVLLSAQAHEVVKTQAFEDESSEIDPVYVARSEAMLKAAASGTPLTLPNGQGTQVLSKTYAKKMVAVLAAGYRKLNTLFDPVWHQ